MSARTPDSLHKAARAAREVALSKDRLSCGKHWRNSAKLTSQRASAWCEAIRLETLAIRALSDDDGTNAITRRVWASGLASMTRSLCATLEIEP